MSSRTVSRKKVRLPSEAEMERLEAVRRKTLLDCVMAMTGSVIALGVANGLTVNEVLGKMEHVLELTRQSPDALPKLLAAGDKAAQRFAHELIDGPKRSGSTQ